jgi:hypothetical protein
MRHEETEEALGGLDLCESGACVVHHTLRLTYTHLDALVFVFVTRLTAVAFPASVHVLIIDFLAISKQIATF